MTSPVRERTAGNSEAALSGEAGPVVGKGGLRREILQRLSDGGFHSGVTLALDLQRSRTAIWKGVKGLAGAGLDIYAIPGKGYRLAEPVELLDADTIMRLVDPDIAVKVERLDVFFTISSTNQYLLDQPSPHRRVALAEYQTAGRGRRGNQWWSPPAGGICLSIGWRFDGPPALLLMLSLLTGVALIRALHRCGIAGVGLKWPNDVVHEYRKLGGILVESRGQLAGPIDAVLGIGLNIRLPRHLNFAFEQPVTDLAAAAVAVPSRNRLAAALISETLCMLDRCERAETRSYVDEWRKLDVGRGRHASLKLAGKEIRGTVMDIDDNGMLVMLIDGEVRRFSSGDLSLRLVP